MLKNICLYENLSFSGASEAAPPLAGPSPRQNILTPPPAGPPSRQNILTPPPAGPSPRPTVLTPPPAGRCPGRPGQCFLGVEAFVCLFFVYIFIGTGLPRLRLRELFTFLRAVTFLQGHFLEFSTVKKKASWFFFCISPNLNLFDRDIFDFACVQQFFFHVHDLLKF